MSLSRPEIDDLLDKEEIVYIATSRPDGSPHVAPIWFVIYRGKIYFETDKTTIKFKNIEANNKVALCFGGKATYIVEGSVRWFTEDKAPLPFRKLLWEKYKDDMDDSYITDKTYIFEVIPKKEISWHYADQDWE